MLSRPMAVQFQHRYIGFVLHPFSARRQLPEQVRPLEPGHPMSLPGSGNPVNQLGRQVTITSDFGNDWLYALNGAHQFVQVDTLALEKRGDVRNRVQQRQQEIFCSDYRTAAAPDAVPGLNQCTLAGRRQASLPIIHSATPSLVMRGASS